MTAITLERTGAQVDLTALTLAELADAYSTAEGDLAGEILAEGERRDRAEKRRLARRADPSRSAWQDGAYAQYCLAERDCRGVLLNSAGIAAGIDPWPALWTGPLWQAERFMSEELRLWHQDNPRQTFTEYAREERRGEEAYRDELDRDGSAGMEPGPSESRPAGPRESGADALPGPAARAEAEASGGAGDMPARDGRHVRPERAMSPAERAEVFARLHAEAEDLRARIRRPAAVAPAPVAVPVAVPAAAAVVAVPDRGVVATRPSRATVDGAQVLTYARRFIGEYARLPDAAADVMALWAAHCHARDGAGTLVFESAPRLMFLSSEPGSGKSRCLSLLRLLTGSRYGLLTEPTARALAHIVGPCHEVALCDEADLLLGKGKRHVQLRAIVHSGFQRDGVIAHMRGSTVEELGVFGPVALAGLDVLETATGDALNALFSRAVVVRMHQSGERVPSLGADARAIGNMIHEALGAWCGTVRGQLATARPEVPEWLIGRAEDVWAPLFAVAEAAGGDWPQRALAAADQLTAGYDEADGDVTGSMDELAAWAASLPEWAEG